MGAAPSSAAEVGPGERFTDVPPGHWAEQDIYRLKELKLPMVGRWNLWVGPFRYPCRVCSILIKLLDLDVQGLQQEAVFNDVKQTDWHWDILMQL